MAQVDFSNAVLDVVSGYTPLSLPEYLRLNVSEFHDSSHNALNYQSWNPNVILQNTPTKVSILYSGTFNVGGTEFYIAYTGTEEAWCVSNISFSAGDVYSFVIDIEVSGNT